MASLRPLCQLGRWAAPRRVGVLGTVGMRLMRAGMWRSMSTAPSSSSSSEKVPTREELIANYPVSWVWGKLITIKTPTGVIKLQTRDGPGLTQHKLFQASLPKEIIPPPPGQLFLTGKSGKIAHGLLNATRDAKCIDQAQSALAAFIDKYKADRSIVAYFHNSTHTAEMQRAYLTEQATSCGAPAPLVDALLKMLAQKRLRKLGELKRMFNRLAAEYKKEKTGSIVSAEPLSEAQYAAIAAKMQKLVAEGEALKIDRQIEPDLVGGVIIRVGNKIHDLSVGTQISRMENHLKAFFASNQQAVDKVLST